MTANAQCELCACYTLPAYSTERVCEECRNTARAVLARADLLRALGVQPQQVESTPGPAGFLERVAAQLADVECDCKRGLPHLRGDHAELEQLGGLGKQGADSEKED